MMEHLKNMRTSNEADEICNVTGDCFVSHLIAVALDQYSSIKHPVSSSSWECCLPPLRAGVTWSRPLGNSPACVYIGETRYNCVYDAIKSFWPKPLLPTVCL